MTIMTDARAAYMGASVATADPSRLLVMLCERLVLDVQRAHTAQLAGHHEEAHHQLLHAQAIVSELRASLDPDGFVGGTELAALYDWLYQQLVLANVRRDPETTAHCEQVVVGIAETWRQAALALVRTGVSTMTETPRDPHHDLVLEWEVELDRLDLEVIRIEKLLTAMKPMDAENWVAPSPSAPMPVHLLPRAIEIHRRQTAVLDKVLRSLRTTSQHRVYVESLSDPRDEQPRYLNATG